MWEAVAVVLILGAGGWSAARRRRRPRREGGWAPLLGAMCLGVGAVFAAAGKSGSASLLSDRNSFALGFALVVLSLPLVVVGFLRTLVRGPAAERSAAAPALPPAPKSVLLRPVSPGVAVFAQVLFFLAIGGMLFAVLGDVRPTPPPVTEAEWAASPEAIWVSDSEDPDLGDIRLGPADSSPWPTSRRTFVFQKFVAISPRNYLPGREDLIGYAATDTVVEGEGGPWRRFRRLTREETLRRVAPRFRISSTLADVAMPDIADRGPALSEREVTEFQRDEGIEFLEDYRQFLLTFNGGRPSRRRFEVHVDSRHGSDVRWSDVEILFGLGRTDASSDLRRNLQAFRATVGADVLPIGRDAQGHLLCLTVRGRDLGDIRLVDPRDNARTPHRVAALFGDFLEALKE